MAVPKFYEMHRTFLALLSDGNTYTKKQVMAHLRDDFHLTEEDLAQMQPSGKQTVFANRVGWAATYLKRAGLIVSPSRGQYCISDAGREVLQLNPDVIDVKFLTRYPSFCEFQSLTSGESVQLPPPEEEEDTPDDVIENAIRRMNTSLAEELMTEVMKMSPVAFERFVLDLMKSMGYGKFQNGARMTSVTNDEGIDGIIMQDKLGFDLIYIQVKHWGEDHIVGRPDVQAFVGAISGKGGKGLFVTTSKFAKPAIEYANNHHIILVDGKKLTELMIENNFGVTVKNTFAIKALDTDVFTDYEEDGH